jgi:membrane protein
MSAINLLISLVAIFLLFSLIYKFVPETRVQWRDVWAGAIATAFCFTLGKELLGVYLGRASVGSAYGAAGSLVVLIVWVYYSALIFLFGAELTRLLRSDRRVL